MGARRIGKKYELKLTDEQGEQVRALAEAAGLPISATLRALIAASLSSPRLRLGEFEFGPPLSQGGRYRWNPLR